MGMAMRWRRSFERVAWIPMPVIKRQGLAREPYTVYGGEDKETFRHVYR